MKCLMWDDEPEKEIKQFKRRMESPDYKIAARLTSKPDFSDFITELDRKDGDWDFFIIDLVLILPNKKEEKIVGHNLATQVNQRDEHRGKPIFMLTSRFSSIPEIADNLPSNVLLKSKKVQNSFLIPEMIRDLQRWGVVYRDKVFVIYGHDQHAPDAKEKLISHLGNKKLINGEKLVVKTVDNVNTTDNFISKLHAVMNECAAIVAICTPDNHLTKHGEETYSPRYNVILEIGIAIGLKGGTHRLVLLDRSSPQDVPIRIQTYFPSDLVGVPTLPFKSDDISAIFPDLDQRLRNIGFEFTESGP